MITKYKKLITKRKKLDADIVEARKEMLLALTGQPCMVRKGPTITDGILTKTALDYTIVNVSFQPAQIIDVGTLEDKPVLIIQ